VTASADGWIEKIEQNTEDNPVGEVDLKNNWGNTIVIRHGERLFSSVSHLRKNSINVKPGEFVKKGQIIGACGNSGRSPVPHLHFQFQSSPEIGAGTISNPISRYVISGGESYELGFLDIPSKGHVVGNIDINPALQEAYRLIPGESKSFKVYQNNEIKSIRWQIESDIYNNTFIHCTESSGKAYFVRDNDMIYFTFYTGSHNTLLYYFYLASFKLSFGFYPGMEIYDRYPLPSFTPPMILWLNDIISPFFTPLSAKYTLRYDAIKGQFKSQEIILKSKAEYYLYGRIRKELSTLISISEGRIDEIKVIKGGQEILKAEWQEE